MEDEVHQIYQVEIQLLNGCKIRVIEKGFGYTLRFKDGKELDCRLVIENQKTLSSLKPTVVLAMSYQTLDDIGADINIKERFTIYDYDSKVGKGNVTEIIYQE